MTGDDDSGVTRGLFVRQVLLARADTEAVNICGFEQLRSVCVRDACVRGVGVRGVGVLDVCVCVCDFTGGRRRRRMLRMLL